MYLITTQRFSPAATNQAIWNAVQLPEIRAAIALNRDQATRDGATLEADDSMSR